MADSRLATSRLPIPPEARRRIVTVTLAPSTIELIDGCVTLNQKRGNPSITRSRLVEQAVLEWFELTREPT